MPAFTARSLLCSSLLINQHCHVARHFEQFRVLPSQPYSDGFRTSFRTWAQEQTDYPREIQEAALGHKVGDAAEQAYARSDYFEKRRQMMEEWATFLDARTK